MKNDRWHDGRIFTLGPKVDSTGASLNTAIRKALATHLREAEALQAYVERRGGRYSAPIAGRKFFTLEDGSTIETRINPFGLDPTYKAFVTAPEMAGLEEEPAERMFYMDFGLLGWTPVSEFPLLVNTYSSLAAYLAGSGTEIPGAPLRDEYLIGTMTLKEGEGPFWLEEAPALDADAKYPSYVRTESYPPTSANDDPARYTGLARLLAQVLLGRGTTISAVLGGYTTPGALWVVRSPVADGPVWWAISLSSSGAVGVPLSIPSELMVVVDWIASGDLTDEEALFGEAWVLGFAVPGTPVSLGSLSSAYAGRSPGPGPWGWCATPQRIGSATQDTAAAVCVMSDGGKLTAGVWRWTTHVGRVSVSGWAGGVPQLAASADASKQWNTGDTTSFAIYQPSSFGNWARLRPPGSSSGYVTAGGDSTAPLLAWYTEEGLKTVNFRYSSTGVNTSNSPAWWPYEAGKFGSQHFGNCGGGTVAGVVEASFKQTKGFDGLAGMDPAQYTYLEKSVYTYTLMPGAEYEDNVPGPFSPSDNCPEQPPPAEEGDVGWFRITVTGTCYGFTTPQYSGCLSYPSQWHAEDYPNPGDPADPIRTITPIGAGSKIDYETYVTTNLSSARRLLIGLYPGTLAHIDGTTWTEPSHNMSTRTLPGDTGVLEIDVLGMTGRYLVDLPNLLSGVSPTSSTVAAANKSTFKALVAVGDSILYDSNSNNWNWADGNNASGLCGSVESYGGLRLTWLPTGLTLPDGVSNPETDYVRWVGGV